MEAGLNDINKTPETTDADKNAMLHNYLMDNNKDYAEEYNKKKMYEEFVAQDQPLQDQSLVMATFGGGLTAGIGYGLGPVSFSRRVAAGLVNKDIAKVAGIPSKRQLVGAAKGIDRQRDKLAWRATNNSSQYNSVNQ